MEWQTGCFASGSATEEPWALARAICGRVDIFPYEAYGYPYMKTTLTIDDQVMRRIKREAAKQNKTMSELVETALRMLLRASQPDPKPLDELPSFEGGKACVDINDRDALYQAMEGR